MEIIKDPGKHKDEIIACIHRYGFNAENNYHHYMYDQTKSLRNVFLRLGDMGIMAVRSRRNIWYLFPNGILAPPEKRFELLLRFIDFALLEQKAGKVSFELVEDLKKQLFDHFRESEKYKLTRINYVLYWPLFDMQRWDHSMQGKNWKKIRNIVNRMENNGKKIDVVDARELPKEKLKKIVDSWIDSRRGEDYVSNEYYYNLIENGFLGFDHVRSICCNGEPYTITAGWKVPNSSCYYSAIGVTDYSFEKDMGVYANIDDLRFLKMKGYSLVDFGGSDKGLLSFKKKFMPHSMYRTYTFSIKLKS